MLVRVAQETGQSVRSVAKESYAVTLWTFKQLQDIGRIERVKSLGERIDTAALMAMAFHEPKTLQDAEREYRRQAGLDMTREQAIAQAERAAQALERHLAAVQADG